ncbi:Rossmann-like domain-containing protein [Piscinibacter sp.]|uniref:Rossmann-like domain-containing protein n=1 Tax=Piscinibacter sp. TaxID=1903157 RepID=UPI0039E307AA
MRAIARELVAAVEGLAAIGPLPRVRRLLLPPAESRNSEFSAVELDDGSIGLSFALLGGALAQLHAGKGAGIAGLPALELARRYADEGEGVQRMLGFAAINALTRHLYGRAGYTPPPARGSMGDLDLGPGDHAGMVGLFPPLVKQVLATGARLTVLELREDLLGSHEGWRVTRDAAELRHCNKVMSTSTVLLNDTLAELLGHCRGAERIAMIGPGAGCLPDALFERGVTLLGGSWIVDAEGFKAALAAGMPWSAHARKTAIARDAWPGAAALLARAASVQR